MKKKKQPTGRMLLYLVAAASFAIALVTVQANANQDAGQQGGARKGGPTTATTRGKKQIVWDFGIRQQTSGHTSVGPAFALEPPALVEYLNSTGAVIACRPTLAAGEPDFSTDTRSSAPGTINQKRAPISISWRQMAASGLLDVVEDDLDWDSSPGPSSSASGQWRELHEDQEQQQGRFVRQDGALVLLPGGANKADQIYRCCLSNQFGSLCSRPVRTRTVPDASGLNLEVFDELAPAGSSIQLRCLSPPTLQKYLDFTHWLKDDKIIASANQLQQPQPINQKYLMLATGELIIRNVSRLADGLKLTGGGSGAFKCRARHRISGQTLTSKVGAKVIIDDQQQMQLENRQPSRSASESQVWAHENSADLMVCVQFSPRSWWSPSAKFVWFFEEQSLNNVFADSQIRQLDSCLLIRQVQLKHAGRYVCETSDGLQRASVLLSVASAKLTAQLQLIPANAAAAAEPSTMAPRPATTQQQQPMVLVQFGASIHLNCSISGHPYDTIVWFKDSRLLAVTSASKNSSQSPAASNLKLILPTVIKIDKFSLNNRGIYQCQVYSTSRLHLNHSSSSFASLAERDQLRSTSASMQLDVASSRPTLVQKFPQNLSLHRGSQVSLQCSAFGLPTPTIIWFLDGFPIVSGDAVLSSSPEVGGDLWDLGVEHASSSDEFLAQFRQFARLAGAANSRNDDALTANVIEDERFKINTVVVESQYAGAKQEDQLAAAISAAAAAAAGERSSMLQMLVVSQLNISQMETTEMGAYKCLAFNSLGFVQHSAYLALATSSSTNNEVRIERRNYQPSKVGVFAGQAASLQCPLIGHPLARVDWFRDESSGQLRPLPSSHRQRIEPINKWGFGGQLELLNVDKSAGDAGLYSCRAARQTSSQLGAANQTSMSYDDDLVGQVRVEVRVATAIDKQTLPELVHVNEGERAKLVCSVVRGDHPIEIRWMRRTHEPRQAASLLAASFEEVRPSKSQAQEPAANEETNMIEPIGITNLEDTSILTFKQISYLDSGDYLCLVSNQVSHSTRLTRLLVNVAPTWSLEPPNELSVLLGSRLQIDCLAHGFPEPTVVWKRRRLRQPSDQQQQQQQQQQRLIESQRAHQDAAASEVQQQEFAEIGPNYKRRQPTNGSLIIEQSDQSDAGWYMCQIGNGIGVGLSKVIRVRVNVAPHFKHRLGSTSSLSSQAQTLRARAELKCLAFGDQPMIIGWRRDNSNDVVDLVNDSRHRLVSEHRLATAMGANSPLALESILQIDNLTRDDSGQYDCVASNEFGTEETHMQLIVQEPPEAPSLLRPIRAGSRQATLTFRPPYSGNSPIKQYAIYYRAQSSSNETSSTGAKLAALEWQQTLVDAPTSSSSQATISGSEFQLQLQPTKVADNSTLLAQQDAPEQQLVNLLLCCLQPFTRYLVKVRAINELGQGELSKVAPFMTDEEAIGGPPLDVAVEPTGAHSLKVRWRAPTRNMQNGLIRGYYIGYRAIGSLGQMQVGAIGPAASSADNPEQYQYKNVQLDLGPALLSGSGQLPGPDSFGEPFIGEPAAINGSQAQHWFLGGSGQAYASYLTNLKRKTAYSIIVQAYNKVGAGPRSDQIIVSTLDAAPPMSPVLKFLSVGYNSAQFAWSSRRFKHDNTTLSQAGHQFSHRPLGLIIDAATINDDLISSDYAIGNPSNSFDTSDGHSDDDDPQSYYTLNFMPDPLANSQAADQEDWQQRRVPARRQSPHSPYHLTNLKCGSRYSAFMTATNSLGQSEPGEMVKFATMGAAPIAPAQAQDFLQVNASYVVLRLGQWQNAGCLITLFIVKYRPLNQLKWTVLEHQVHPNIQTLTVSGSALISTRADFPDVPGRRHLPQVTVAAASQPAARISKLHSAQVLSDFIIRNLLQDTNYKLIVEANSEAGSTLAEYEFETGNFTSSTVAINVNGLNAADLAGSSGGLSDNRPFSLVEPENGMTGELLDFNYGGPNGQRGLASSNVVGPLQRYALGVWSLTALFVVGSILMAVATIILGFRSFMRMKPNELPDGGLMSAMLCCSGSSSSRSSSSDNADSSHSSSGGHPLGGPCYQLPDIHLSHNQLSADPAMGYCSLAGDATLAGGFQLNRQTTGRYLEGGGDESMIGEPGVIPFRQMVSSSSLSTIGRFNAHNKNNDNNNNNSSSGGTARNTNTLGRISGQDQQRQLMRSTCYAATLGKQQSSFVGQTPIKFNQEQLPIYGRLQHLRQNEQNNYLGHGEPSTQFNFNPQPVSSSTGTSGYETGGNSMTMKLGCPSELSEQQPVYLRHSNNYHHPHLPAPEVATNYGDIAESNLYEANHLNQYQPDQRQPEMQNSANYNQEEQQRYSTAFSISGNKAIDCDQTQQLLSSAYGMIFGNQQQQNKQDFQQQQQQQQLEPQELAQRLQALTAIRRQQD